MGAAASGRRPRSDDRHPPLDSARSCGRSADCRQVPVEPDGRPRQALLRGLIPDLAIQRDRLVFLVAARMVEVDDDGAMTDLLPANAGILETLAELPVESSPFHPLVEAVDAEEILAPGGGIVPVPGRTGRSQQVEQ